KGIVAASIENDEIHRIARLAYAFDQTVHVDAQLPQVLDAGDLCIDREQVVAPRELGTVTSEIEQPDRPGLCKSVCVPAYRFAHVRLRQFEPEIHPKAGLLELFGHSPGVVDRIAEGGLPVLAVADDEGYSPGPQQRGRGRGALREEPRRGQ